MAEREEDPLARASARNRRLQWILGGVLALGVVVAAGFALLVVAGEDEVIEPDVPGIGLPEPRITSLQPAVEAAGCRLTHPPIEGDRHEDRTFTAADYDSNPPTSGPHAPVAAPDGIHPPGSTPPLGELVHALEHGRINVQYAPGADASLMRRLEAFVAENGGYHTLLFENETGMDAQVAAAAWGHLLTCPRAGPRLWDALRAFRDRYIDQAPEQVP